MAIFGDQPATGLDQINGSHTAYTAEKSYTGGAAFEIDANPNVKSLSPYREFGFPICDPDYRNGVLPHRDGHNRTDVE